MITLKGDPRKEATQRVRERIASLCLWVQDECSEEGQELVLSAPDFLVRGEKGIQEKLDELEEYKAEWDRFQSDACYVNKDGSTC